jgi:hypothetical protein
VGLDALMHANMERIFNERNAQHRLAALGELYANDAIRYDPEAAVTLEKALLNDGNVTGVYLDEKARPMRGSDQVHDPAFQDRVVDETRALLPARGTCGRGRTRGARSFPAAAPVPRPDLSVP